MVWEPERVFSEPWHAHVFALTVRLSEARPLHPGPIGASTWARVSETLAAARRFGP